MFVAWLLDFRAMPRGKTIATRPLDSIDAGKLPGVILSEARNLAYSARASKCLVMLGMTKLQDLHYFPADSYHDLVTPGIAQA